MRRVAFLLVLAIACRNDQPAVAARSPSAEAPKTIAVPRPTPIARVRKRIAVAAAEAAGALEDRFDAARREVKDRFASRLGVLLGSAHNQSDYWTVVMDSATPPATVRDAFYDPSFKLTSGSCQFSPGDTVATYECSVGDPAPFSDLNSKLAAYADASRRVIPASWIQAGEDGSFRAVNPFCRGEQIRFAAADSLRITITLPYGAPCGPPPYNASTSKS